MQAHVSTIVLSYTSLTTKHGLVCILVPLRGNYLGHWTPTSVCNCVITTCMLINFTQTDRVPVDLHAPMDTLLIIRHPAVCRDALPLNHSTIKIFHRANVYRSAPTKATHIIPIRHAYTVQWLHLAMYLIALVHTSLTLCRGHVSNCVQLATLQQLLPNTVHRRALVSNLQITRQGHALLPALIIHSHWMLTLVHKFVSNSVPTLTLLRIRLKAVLRGALLCWHYKQPAVVRIIVHSHILHSGVCINVCEVVILNLQTYSQGDA